MREGWDRVSTKPVPRPFKITLFVSGLVLFAAAICLAQTAPDNALKTQGADNQSTDNTTPQTAATRNIATIKDNISRTITSFEKDIRNAYYRQLVGNPNIDGEITISFTVQPGGDVTDVKVDKSSLNWPPLEEEILIKVKDWKFTPFEGEPIQASVPYKFQPN